MSATDIATDDSAEEVVKETDNAEYQWDVNAVDECE